MKKLTLPLLLIVLLSSCAMLRNQPVSLGMSETQFVKGHYYATKVEMSDYRTVYKDTNYAGVQFYYFKDGKMYLMDQGYTPIGTIAAVPTP